jgi:PAS domain-containing protein
MQPAAGNGIDGHGLGLLLTQSTLHMLLNAAPVAIVAVNEQGDIVFANERLT